MKDSENSKGLLLAELIIRIGKTDPEKVKRVLMRLAVDSFCDSVKSAKIKLINNLLDHEDKNNANL